MLEKKEHDPEWLICACMRFELLELALELTLSLIHKVRFSPPKRNHVLPSRDLSAGRVASRPGPTKNSHVDVATLHPYRPATRRDEREDAERPIQTGNNSSSGFAPRDL